MSLTVELKKSEQSILQDHLDFAGTYMAVSNLKWILNQEPGLATSETIVALERVFLTDGHRSQRQAYFLFRAVARMLADIFVRHDKSQIRDEAILILKNLVRTSQDPLHRASAEALGSLPLKLQPNDQMQHLAKRAGRFNSEIQKIPTIDLKTWLSQNNYASHGKSYFMGRSILTPIDADRVLTVKLAVSSDNLPGLYQEVLWMDFFNTHPEMNGHDFKVPQPVKVENRFIFRLKQLPKPAEKHLSVVEENYAIGYIAPSDYFTYPNDTGFINDTTPHDFKAVLLKNAFLLGRFAGMGLIHTAPIPLFHNRIQQDRRQDQGLYEWQRAGRLDQWLFSCRYPNIGVTGLRDFEHLEVFDKTPLKLYQYVGMHILSLMLILGSYFRNKNPQRFGWDEFGKPVDTRDQFDPVFLKEMIGEIFNSYYHGFCQKPFCGTLPMDIDPLVASMIDEMGVDHYMEEILRAADQKSMSDAAFVQFLHQKGFTKEFAHTSPKGAKDISILSGPHLGGFNDRISIPELIRFSATTASFCISDRYCESAVLN